MFYILTKTPPILLLVRLLVATLSSESFSKIIGYVVFRCISFGLPLPSCPWLACPCPLCLCVRVPPTTHFMHVLLWPPPHLRYNILSPHVLSYNIPAPSCPELQYPRPLMSRATISPPPHVLIYYIPAPSCPELQYPHPLMP